MPVHRTCLQCGIAFSTRESRRKFCSPRCHYDSMRGKPGPNPRLHGPRPCVICAAVFENSHAKILTCSRPCGYELKFRNYMARAEERAGGPLGAFITQRLDAGFSVRDVTRELGLADNRQLHRIMARFAIPVPTPSEAVRKQWLNNPERRAAIGRVFSAWARANPERSLARSIAANLALQITSPTTIERRLMSALDAAGLCYEFQYVVGNKFLCDFAFPDARLIVEADGSYWHRTERQKKRDTSKDAYLRACGFAVLRLTEQEITHSLDSCLERIRALLPIESD